MGRYRGGRNGKEEEEGRAIAGVLNSAFRRERTSKEPEEEEGGWDHAICNSVVGASVPLSVPTKRGRSVSLNPRESLKSNKHPGARKERSAESEEGGNSQRT